MRSLRQFALGLGVLAAIGILVAPESAHAALGFFQIPENPRASDLGGVVGILVNIIRFGLLFAASVAVLFVVVNGYQYIFSAGNPEKVEKAKQGLTWSIAGFILTICSYAIVLLVQGVLRSRQKISDAPGIVGAISGAPQDPQSILPRIADALLLLSASVAVLFIIINGYRYATSQGNQDQVQAARRGLLYSVIGLAVVFLSYAIVVTIGRVVTV